MKRCVNTLTIPSRVFKTPVLRWHRYSLRFEILCAIHSSPIIFWHCIQEMLVMGNVVALPFDLCFTESGIVLTCIVPAAAGCNVACAFCFIRQRQQILDPAALSPEDFARFIRGAAARQAVRAIAIQGYEPLLPSSLAYTQAILAA